MNQESRSVIRAFAFAVPWFSENLTVGHLPPSQCIWD